MWLVRHLLGLAGLRDTSFHGCRVRRPCGAQEDCNVINQDSQIVFASRVPLRLSRTSGLAGKSCAISVRRPSFVLMLGHWPHIGPVPGATLGCLWGPGGFPKGAQRIPRDNPRRPKPFPWSASGLPLGAGPPEGGRGLQGDNTGDPKWASRRRGAQVKKTPKNDEH